MYQKPIRHGDVDLIPCIIPENPRLEKTDLVMHGENGHSHTLINGQILIHEGRRFLKSNSETYLIHEEHKKIRIPQGTFEIMQEEEFDPFTETIRRIRD